MSYLYLFIYLIENAFETLNYVLKYAVHWTVSNECKSV